MATTNTIITCAACGKEESEDNNLKACTACNLVKYCNRDCQVSHRPQHKSTCKKRAATAVYDQALFKESPVEHCPLCMLPMQRESGIAIFYPCCGKVICGGCTYDDDNQQHRGNRKRKEMEETHPCPNCKMLPVTSDEEEMARIMKLIQSNNAHAYNLLARCYATGEKNVPQDKGKAIRFLLRAGELGCAESYYTLGQVYAMGTDVEVDEKKSRHFYELAAMKGDTCARYQLGRIEGEVGNHHRAFTHFLIAARAGHTESFNIVEQAYMNGSITKEKYDDTSRAHDKRINEMKSDMRDRAEAAASLS